MTNWPCYTLFCKPCITRRDGAGHDGEALRKLLDLDQLNTGAMPASPGVRQYPCHPGEYLNSKPASIVSPLMLSNAVTRRTELCLSPVQSETAALADVAVTPNSATLSKTARTRVDISVFTEIAI
jgi:hypothetical protein